VLESEKGISKDIIIDAIEAALISAYKRNFNQAQNVRVSFNPEVGTIQVLARKDVVDNVFDPRLEISVEEARQINPNYQDGDVLEIEV
ncbi:transcription termination/antitermination protein NusA, partial [Escherichia coli]|nr:transcription termination/antitermination protein NusA [Escherichia coli]